MDRLYIVMPAYNEQDNIEEVVRSWYQVILNHNLDGQSKLIVINDGSTDKTSKIGHQLMEELPFFEMIDKPNSGHGPTVIYAYNYAIQAGADYIFQTDSDGQTNPEEFEEFWTLRGQYDGIFGQRVVREDGQNRAFVEKVVCILLRIYFGVQISDANVPFRLMKADIVKKYIEKLPLDYALPNIMISTFFSYYNERITFKTITFKPRQGGVNSMNFKKIMKIGIKSLREFKTFRKQIDIFHE